MNHDGAHEQQDNGISHNGCCPTCTAKINACEVRLRAIDQKVGDIGVIVQKNEAVLESHVDKEETMLDALSERVDSTGSTVDTMKGSLKLLVQLVVGSIITVVGGTVLVIGGLLVAKVVNGG